VVKNDVSTAKESPDLAGLTLTRVRQWSDGIIFAIQSRAVP